MDQKNTIVKCKAHPDCLFNYNGVCDNYVINIGADGRCDCYVETERADNFEISEIKKITLYQPGSKEPFLTLYEPQRGQQTKDSVCDYEPFLTKTICNQCRYDPHGHLCSRKNVASNGIWTCWEKKE